MLAQDFLAHRTVGRVVQSAAMLVTPKSVVELGLVPRGRRALPKPEVIKALLDCQIVIGVPRLESPRIEDERHEAIFVWETVAIESGIGLIVVRFIRRRFWRRIVRELRGLAEYIEFQIDRRALVENGNADFTLVVGGTTYDRSELRLPDVSDVPTIADRLLFAVEIVDLEAYDP